MEGDNILLMKAEYSKRESDYMEIIRILQEDYEKFKVEVAKEFDIKDSVQKRFEDHVSLLRRELILAQNVIKNPGIFNKISENMGAETTEEYRYIREDPGNKS